MPQLDDTDFILRDQRIKMRAANASKAASELIDRHGERRRVFRFLRHALCSGGLIWPWNNQVGHARPKFLHQLIDDMSCADYRTRLITVAQSRSCLLD